MVKDLALFLLSCIPSLLCEGSGSHHTARKRHQKKVEIVKTLWIISGVIMLIFPVLFFVVSLGLFTTFLSFTILDETV